jgi:hypothetical protein
LLDHVIHGFESTGIKACYCDKSSMPASSLESELCCHRDAEEINKEDLSRFLYFLFLKDPLSFFLLLLRKT